MVKVSFCGSQETAMLAIMNLIRDVDMEKWRGMMEASTRVIG